jgi:hypothetical protein
MPRQATTESTMADTGSSMARRTSSGERMIVLGRPLMRSRPRTSALISSRTADADPMAILMSSAVRSPMAMPYSRRMKAVMAASMSKLPMRTALRATTPPSEMSAVSDVPPPTSTTMLATGSWMGRPAPIAAAMGCSMSWASVAPARRAASITARRSTSVMADGTQMTTRGRLNRFTPTRWRSSRIIRWVMSKSVMAPWRSGRTATM